MPLLESNSFVFGQSCPDFVLPAVDDTVYGLKDFSASQALLVAFICNHCPYVKAIEDRLIGLRQAFSSTELAMVGICSNDAQAFPDDSPEQLKQRWLQKAYGFPYLIDAEQTVARSFDAVCTPDLFLFDKSRRLFYHGRLDDNWRDENAVTKEELKEAISKILAHKPPPSEQKPSMGCSIKWKAGS